MKKKMKFRCGIDECPGHTSKMGCYQHRSTIRKEGIVPESTFGPIEAIRPGPRTRKAKKRDTLPIPLTLTPIAKKSAYEQFMERLLPVLMDVEPRYANITLELTAGPFFKRMLTIKFEER